MNASEESEEKFPRSMCTYAQTPTYVKVKKNKKQNHVSIWRESCQVKTASTLRVFSQCRAAFL